MKKAHQKENSGVGGRTHEGSDENEGSWLEVGWIYSKKKNRSGGKRGFGQRGV